MIRHAKPNIKRNDLVGVLECLVSDNLTGGDTVREFERQFAALFGLRSNHAVAVGSGTDALFLGLKAMGIGPGDQVVLPSYLPAGPWHAVRNTGAEVVLCDIGEDLNISAADAAAKITAQTKAVLVPHLFGMPADIAALEGLGVPLVEDCAQSLGAKYHDKLTGSFGKFSFFSFNESKMITTGYGGMLVTRDARLAAQVRSMRSCERTEEIGEVWSSNLTDFQAAMGINQLKRLDHFIDLRKRIAELYNKKLLQSHHEVPRSFEGRDQVFCRYTVRLQRSLKQSLEFLRKNNIEAEPPVFKPLHRYLGLEGNLFPETERAFMKTVSIPIYPALLTREAEFVAKVAGRLP